MDRDAKFKALMEILQPRQIQEIVARFPQIIGDSFKEERRSKLILLPSEKVTAVEVKRRTDICYDWLMIMKVDCHLSLAQAMDALPRALRATLNGDEWEPPNVGRSWGTRERVAQ